MENTIKNKKRFFAQYETQEIAKSSKSAIPHIVSAYFAMGHHYLELKPLSTITDEDAKEISPMKTMVLDDENKYIITSVSYFERIQSLTVYFKYKDNETPDDDEGFGHSSFTIFPFQSQYIVDYLRSKGYALPWMGLSVEKLVEYGWIKLKND